jgi:hypothetical protein
MSAPVIDEKLRAGIHEIAMAQRHNGREEFRIAAARMFEKLKMGAAGFAVLNMEVDRYLTAEEIAERERTP